MRHIVYILPYLEKGGTETHVLELIKGFNQKFKITLLAPPGPRLEEFKEYDINYIPFTNLNNNLLKGLKELNAALKRLKEKKIDLIHIHGAHELILLTKLKIKKTPLIFTVHGYHDKFKKLTYKLSSIFNNFWADDVITISKSERKILLNSGLNLKKLSLIYNGVSLPDNYSQDNLSNELLDLKQKNIKFIGTVARLEEAKGIKYLIKSFAKVATKKEQLLIIGSGSLLDELKQLTEELDITSQVTFTGYVQNVHDYLDLLDIFILPSLQEPFGLVCAEAMAHSLPVITTNSGGVTEVVQNQKTGFIVPKQDTKALAEKIKLLLQDQELCQTMGSKGYNRYQSLFSYQKFLNSTEQIYYKYL